MCADYYYIAVVLRLPLWKRQMESRSEINNAWCSNKLATRDLFSRLPLFRFLIFCFLLGIDCRHIVCMMHSSTRAAKSAIAYEARTIIFSSILWWDKKEKKKKSNAAIANGQNHINTKCAAPMRPYSFAQCTFRFGVEFHFGMHRLDRLNRNDLHRRSPEWTQNTTNSRIYLWECAIRCWWKIVTKLNHLSHVAVVSERGAEQTSPWNYLAIRFQNKWRLVTERARATN